MNLFKKQEQPFLTDVAQHVGAFRGQCDGLMWWEVKDNQVDPFAGILKQVQEELSSCASIDRCRIILVDVFLRGRTIEASVACVMIGGTTQKQRKKAVRLLRRSSLLEKYPGLNIDQWESPPHVPNIIMAGEKGGPADNSLIYQNSDFSLCEVAPTATGGETLLSIHSKDENGQELQSGTVSCLVSVRDRKFLFSPAHIFLPLPPEEPDEGGFSDDSSSDLDSELELMRSGSVTPAYLRSEFDDATSDVVLPDVSYPTSPINLREPVLDRQNVEIFSLELDYALLSVPQGLNLTEQLSEISKEMVVKVKDALVGFTTPNNGPITGRLSGRPTPMSLPHTHKFVNVYPIRCFGPVVRGDCGSMVSDKDSDNVFGFIVATSVEGRVAYIVSADDIFSDIESKITSHRVPQTEEKSISEVRHVAASDEGANVLSDLFSQMVSSDYTVPTTNVTRLLGGYGWLSEQKERAGNIILEHAEHGFLLDFFEKKAPPYKPDEISSLWTSIAGIAKGVEFIHEQYGYTGLYLDLKPANIAVSPGDDPRNKFSYIFKIIDFEFSHIARQQPGPNGSKTARVIDRKTSKTYAPPELVLGDEINYHVGSEVDLWSLGCIILECAVWISLGERGRLDFIEGRTKETGFLNDYTESDHGDCFHDGTGVLRCVREFGQHIRDHGRRDDEITSQIFDLALRELLVEKYKRQPARHIYSAMKSIIDTEANLRATSLPNPTNGVLTRRHGSITEPPMAAFLISEQEHFSSYTSRVDPEARSPVSESNLEMSTAEHGSSRKESPTIFPTVDDVSKWIERKKISGNTPELPGWEGVQAQLKGREFIFIIDNSRTMQNYEDQVKTSVHSLSYLVKRLDQDGAEIMCTSDPMNRAKFKHATGHLNFVTENFSRGKGGHCNMEFALEIALYPIGDQLQNSASKNSTGRASWRSLPGKLSSRKKPVTVIVFTDGIWGSSIGGGAEHPIQALISKIIGHEVRRSTVAIQFLRFGSSPDGERRLRYLDDDLPNEDRNSGIDIVDTKPVTESVWDILIGSLDEQVDGTAHVQSGTH